MAGHDTSTRKVLALGGAQRNRAAALVVAGQNFTDPDVLVMVVVGSVLMLLILVPLAGVLGRRAGARRNEGRTPA
jgi:BASS family bile acid:Na+ symporter